MMKYIKKNKGKILIVIGTIIIAMIAGFSYSENKKNANLEEFRTYLDSYKDETSQYILDGKEEQYQTLLETSQLALEEEKDNELINLKGELESLKESIIKVNVEFITSNFNELKNIDISVLQEARKVTVTSNKSEVEELIKEKKYKDAKEKILILKEEIISEIGEINKAKEAEEKATKEAEENIVKEEVTPAPNTVSNGSYVSKLKVANQTDQLVIVKGNGGANATIEYHKKNSNGEWNQVFSTGGYVGQNGITYNKMEGDRKTPAGIYSFGTAFGVAANPGTSISYRVLTNNDYWVDDSNSKYYNKWAKGDTTDKDWNSAEHMIKYSDAYRYGIVINYNTYSTIPGKGSAIFFHCATGPTLGCVSIPDNYLVNLLKNISSSARIVIAASGNDINNY